MSERLKIAIQKSGRLSEKSLALLVQCGLSFELRKDRLIQQCTNFPIDLMLVRDDDIPKYVSEGVCHLGIVGQNMVEEKYFSDPDRINEEIQIIFPLGFGNCRLSIAIPENMNYLSIRDLNHLKIATSYPSCLKRFLSKNGIQAEIIELSGAVEIAPNLKIADAICDLISTGATLKSHGLREVVPLFESQALIIRTSKPLFLPQSQDLNRLIQRIEGVIRASQSKYIMMNAPKLSLTQIQEIIPGMESPSVIPIGTHGDRVAIHAVARENVFWETIENLKSVGATSILVLPIEKVVP